MNSSNTGTLSYSYDAMGNMTNRNGDSYFYNANGKLKEIVTAGGDKFEYKYDHSGNRIKKTLKNANTTTYSFGNLYEIYRSPGEPEKHTMYVIGTEGDIVAQYSRSDANLLQTVESAGIFYKIFCDGITLDCDVYWKNRLGTAATDFLAITHIYANGRLGIGFRAIPWVLLVMTLCIWVYLTRREVTEDTNTENASDTGIFGIDFLPNLTHFYRTQIPRYGLSFLVVIFSFTNTVGCFPLLMGGGEGGGKSHITYKPYGEILRTNSYGPDIMKYKYTGQEEDRGSGLYYYKARYYDNVKPDGCKEPTSGNPQDQPPQS